MTLCSREPWEVCRSASGQRLWLPSSVEAKGPRLGGKRQKDQQAGPEDGPELKGQMEVATSHRYVIARVSFYISKRPHGRCRKCKKLKITKKKVKITPNPSMVNILMYNPHAFNLPSICNLSNLWLPCFPQLGSHYAYNSVTCSFQLIRSNHFPMSFNIQP